jgi:hypothetical protein
MRDWYSEHFSLKGKSRQQKLSVVWNHLLLLVGFYVVGVGGTALLFAESLVEAIIVAAIFTVFDLVLLGFGFIAEL